MFRVMAALAVGVLATLLLVIAPANPAYSTQPGDGQKAFGSGQAMTRELRVQLARDWKNDIQQLADAIPTLSPAEAEWLRLEYDEELRKHNNTITPRVIAALGSKEYNLRVAGERMRDCSQIIERLSSGAIRDRQQEILLWTSLANHFLDIEPNQSLLSLARLGIIDRSLLFSSSFAMGDETIVANRQAWGVQILQRLTIPYLAGKLP